MPELTLTGLRRGSESESDLDALFDQRPRIPGELKLHQRYLSHGERLLTFLYHQEISPTTVIQFLKVSPT
jgi:hypothetical protein